MDIIEQYIADALVTIRRFSESPDAESIFQYISTKNARSFTMSDIGEALDELKKSSVENKQTRKGFNSFFLVRDQSNVDSDRNRETPHSELS